MADLLETLAGAVLLAIIVLIMLTVEPDPAGLCCTTGFAVRLVKR